ncbi:putative transcription factor MYB-HB-like family [Helianthus debilis subsp. tardiflorus]
METRRRKVYDEMGEIKKGPWKTEEDEVLMKHVKDYGAKEWSSIRSKGLLQRTGKSCRLRWVNKLRPDLKSGVKFSAEEERTVIELQGQFGNKWARIATYLPGRTDNDVKNFWSSRQKRLARVLQSPPRPQPSQKSHKSVRETPVLHKVPPFEAPKRSSSTDGESSVTSPKTLSCSSSYCEPIKMMPLPELIDPTTTTTTAAATDAAGLLNQDENQPPCPFGYTSIPVEENSCNQPPLLQDFHHIPPPPPPFDTHDIFNQLADPNFFAVFGQSGTSEMVHFPYMPPGGEGESGGSCEREEGNDPIMMAPDTFIDDFPMDMFDNIEPLPSPSEW